MAQRGVQRVGGVLQLGLRALQHLEGIAQRRVVVEHTFERTDRLGAARVGRVVVLADRGQRRLHRVDDGLRVAQAVVLGVELRPFVGAGGQLVELGDLPLQPLALAFQVGLAAARVGELFACAAPRAPGGGQRRGVEAGIAVEQAAHRVGPRQALPGVLPVDVDQVLARLAQLADGGRAAVDPRTALALGVERAAQQQGVVATVLFIGEAGIGQPGPQRGRRVELGADLGARRALAHHAGVAAVAERELQRIDQDGLAGTGLAGERGEPGLQVELERGHDDEVAQGDALQHGVFLSVPPTAQECAPSGSTPSFQCSLRRSVA
ncbi:hypothetical protein X551_02468 [Methylibium sp. T29]|nr:hypothetical protein X551_02468 [Methylibium sp. T29]